MSNIPYTVNSYDVCTSGFERLRNRDEFMLVVPVYNSDTRETIRDSLKHDALVWTERDWFHLDVCKAAIDAFCNEQIDEKGFPDLEDVPEDEEGCSIFVYLQAPCEVPVY